MTIIANTLRVKSHFGKKIIIIIKHGPNSHLVKNLGIIWENYSKTKYT